MIRGAEVNGDVPIHVLAISGSLRIPSHTQSLVNCAGKAIAKVAAVEIEQWSVADPQLPLADVTIRDARDYDDPVVARFGEVAKQAEASLWATPIYHGSYTGALKNALDILHEGFFDYKVIGLLSHGGNRNTSAIDHLRIVARSLQAFVIPTQVCTINDDFIEDETCVGGYRLISENVEKRLDRFAHEFVSLTRATRSMRQA